MILIEKLARCIPNEMEEERARVKIIRQEGKKYGDAIVRRVLSLVWTSKLSTIFPCRESEEEDRMPVVTHPPPYAPRSYVLNKEPIRRAGAWQRVNTPTTDKLFSLNASQRQFDVILDLIK